MSDAASSTTHAGEQQQVDSGEVERHAARIESDAPVVLGAPAPAPTGDDQVDAALAAAHSCDGQDLQAQIDQLELVHARLQSRLSDPDD